MGNVAESGGQAARLAGAGLVQPSDVVDHLTVTPNFLKAYGNFDAYANGAFHGLLDCYGVVTLQAANLLVEWATLRPLLPINLGPQTIGTSEVAIVHSLANIPTNIWWTPTSPGQIWMSTPPDVDYIYLTADGAGVTCILFAN